jgi:hypothetical protein
MTEEEYHIPFLEDEEARCSGPGCGRFIKTGKAFRSLINLPYCSQDCLDTHYRKLGIYELVHRDLAKKVEAELDNLDNEQNKR